MVTELQFIAIAAFLLWGLVSSVSGMLHPDADDQAWWLEGEAIDAGAAAGSAPVSRAGRDL